MPAIPVLEIGGTHVTGALVDSSAWDVVPGSVTRNDLDAAGSAAELIAGLAACAQRLSAPPGARWGVALPGPFDHARGIGRYAADKFTALNGVDVGAALAAQLQLPPGAITFCDDAEMFLLGEWLAGAAQGHDRVAGITLGTGIGSAFLAAGRIISDGDDVPAGGDVYRLQYRGQPVEDTVSRRALRREYAAAASITGPEPDVHEIAAWARAGDDLARLVFIDAFTALGEILAPWLTSFGATVLVVGGSIARSWDLIETPLRAGLTAGHPANRAVVVQVAARPEEGPLIGTAWRTLNTP